MITKVKEKERESERKRKSAIHSYVSRLRVLYKINSLQLFVTDTFYLSNKS